MNWLYITDSNLLFCSPHSHSLLNTYTLHTNTNVCAATTAKRNVTQCIAIGITRRVEESGSNTMDARTQTKVSLSTSLLCFFFLFMLYLYTAFIPVLVFQPLQRTQTSNYRQIKTNNQNNLCSLNLFCEKTLGFANNWGELFIIVMCVFGLVLELCSRSVICYFFSSRCVHRSKSIALDGIMIGVWDLF